MLSSIFFFSLLVSTWTISLALSSRLLIFSLSDLLSSHSVYFSLIFFFLFLATLGLCCCVGLFSSCSKQWLLFTWSVWASHCGGVTRCAAWALGLGGLSSCSSQALEHRLNGCEADLLASAFGISLGQGLNLRLLCRPVDSLPLKHHRSPMVFFLIDIFISRSLIWIKQHFKCCSFICSGFLLLSWIQLIFAECGGWW